MLEAVGRLGTAFGVLAAICLGCDLELDFYKHGTSDEKTMLDFKNSLKTLQISPVV